MDHPYFIEPKLMEKSIGSKNINRRIIIYAHLY